MCGIFGLIGKLKNSNKALTIISKTQKYRGPDKTGFYKDKKNNVLIGTNRLSIIDEKKGDQPLKSEDNNFIITFNGTIYNFRKIKKFLISKNFKFKTDCDTEVVLKSYVYWGTKCFNYFDGMWAVAIYDKKKRTITLSRDYVGQKPLYYFVDRKKLIYSSSLVSILKTKLVKKEINEKAVHDFFTFSSINAPKTLFKNILQVRPGENIIYNLEKDEINKNFYWQIEKGPNYNRFFKHKLNIMDIFLYNFRNFTIGDSKPYLFLSRGIDSNLIREILSNSKRKFKTISAVFDNKNFDEFKKDHFDEKINKVILTKDKSKKILKKLKNSLDNVNGDPGLIPSYFLYYNLRKKTKFTIGGEGADELFFGYPSFKAFKIFKIFKLIFPRFLLIKFKNFSNMIKFDKSVYINDSFRNKFKLFFSLVSEKLKDIHTILSGGQLTNDELTELFKKKKDYFYSTKNFFKKNNLTESQNYYLKNYMTKYMDKTDQSSMLNSIEHRAPFLTKDSLNFSLHERESLFSFIKPKKKLVELIKFINPKFNIQKKKQGFTFPLRDLIEDKKFVISLINKKFLINENFFFKSYDKFIRNEKDYSQYLWNEIIYNLYLQKINKI